MELLLAQDVTTDSIYGAKAPLITGTTIVLQERELEYQMNITSDIALNIDTSKLSEFNKYTCEFTLIIYSDRDHTINLADCDVQQVQAYRGITKLHFRHIVGCTLWNVNIVQVGDQKEQYVKCRGNINIDATRYGLVSCIASSSSGGYVSLFEDVNTPNDVWNSDKIWAFWNTPSPTVMYINFPAPFIITQINNHVGTNISYNLMTMLKVYGSNDTKNWTQVLVVNDITYTTAKEIKRYTPTVQKPFKV